MNYGKPNLSLEQTAPGVLERGGLGHAEQEHDFNSAQLLSSALARLRERERALDYETHQLGLRALEAVLLRRAIIGMFFSGSVLWFNYLEFPIDREDAYLRIENGWAVFHDNEPGDCIPTNLQRDYRDLAAVAARLVDSRVRSIRLGSQHGHLWLTFDNSDTLFVNGEAESYESWELRRGEDYLVVALAGGDLAVSLPDSGTTG